MEISVALLGVPICLLRAKFRRFAAIAYLLAVGTVLLLWRSPWLMLPAFAVISQFFSRPATSKLAKYSAAIMSVLGSVLSLIFPVPTTPPLTGPHTVGTRTLEIPATTTGEPKLVVQIWYPSSSASGETEKWLPDPDLARSFPLDRQRRAISQATKNAPLARTESRKRVVFYEHAWNGHRNENVAQVQDLASNGFVVVAIDHPGQASRITYADGAVITTATAPMPDFSSGSAIRNFQEDAQQLMERRATNLARARTALATELVAGDLAKAADWEKVGVFGFSFGGSSAISLCSTDNSLIAGANEDGLYLQNEIPDGPFLFIDQSFPPWLKEPPAISETPEQVFIRQAEARVQKAIAEGKQRMEVSESSHLDFSDRKFLAFRPFAARSALELHQQITSSLVAFFKSALGPS